MMKTASAPANGPMAHMVSATAVFCGLFIVLPFKVKPYIVVALLLVALLAYFKSDTRPGIPFKKIGLCAMVLVLYAASLAYSADLNSGTKILSRIVPIVLVPLGICLLPQDLRSRFIAIFNKTFVCAAAVYVGMIFAYLYYLGYFDQTRSLVVCYSYIMNLFFGFNDHPIYISTYFSVALLLILSGTFKNKWLNGILFTILFIGLLVMARKGIIAAFLVISGLIVLVRFNKKTRWTMVFVLLGFFAASLLVPEIRARFTELSHSENIVNSTETSSGVRYIIWKTSLGLIKHSPVLGYGVGDVQQILDQGVVDKGYPELLSGHYNCHNQYFQISLSCGIIGLVLFAFGPVFFLYRMIRRKQMVTAAFLMFFGLVFCIESMLERQNGVIIYSFITSIFIFAGDRLKNANHE